MIHNKKWYLDFLEINKPIDFKIQNCSQYKNFNAYDKASILCLLPHSSWDVNFSPQFYKHFLLNKNKSIQEFWSLSFLSSGKYLYLVTVKNSYLVTVKMYSFLVIVWNQKIEIFFKITPHLTYKHNLAFTLFLGHHKYFSYCENKNLGRSYVC